MIFNDVKVLKEERIILEAILFFELLEMPAGHWASNKCITENHHRAG